MVEGMEQAYLGWGKNGLERAGSMQGLGTSRIGKKEASRMHCMAVRRHSHLGRCRRRCCPGMQPPSLRLPMMLADSGLHSHSSVGL